VRVLDEILGALQFSEFEAQYHGSIGQPPIHPRVMVGVVIYGMIKGLLASRALEDACLNRLDFMWLTERRKIDHSTICQFRTDFGAQIGQLLRQVVELAVRMDLSSLGSISLDGTRVRANSSRHGTRTAKQLAKDLAGVQEQIDRLLAEAAEADRRDDERYGSQHTPNRLPRRLADKQRRRQRIEQALGEAQRRDAEAEAQRSGKKDEKRKPARVPVADPDSRVSPNKEGGHAPNFTPVAAVENKGGLIVDTDVVAEPNESATTVPAVQRVQECYGQRPEQLLADSHHGTGPNLQQLDQMGVEALVPVQDWEDGPGNPARRADPSRAVAAHLHDQLPMRKEGILDRAAFVYDAEQDCYWCPMGRRLGFWHARERGGRGERTERKYRSADCSACPLSPRCLRAKAKRRTVGRDQYQKYREEAMSRLEQECGARTYARRFWASETPFAVIKHVMGLRQFLTRSLQKVKSEWLWACTAYDVRKLMAAVQAGAAQLPAGA
jgi:transposase